LAAQLGESNLLIIFHWLVKRVQQFNSVLSELEIHEKFDTLRC